LYKLIKLKRDSMKFSAGRRAGACFARELLRKSLEFRPAMKHPDQNEIELESELLVLALSS
jgi:hypothetical protein